MNAPLPPDSAAITDALATLLKVQPQTAKSALPPADAAQANEEGANKEKEMPVTCDRCGKESSIKNKPDGVHWRDWMSESSRGAEAIVIVPCGGEELGVICMTCVQVQLDKWNESRTEEAPNV